MKHIFCRAEIAFAIDSFSSFSRILEIIDECAYINTITKILLSYSLKYLAPLNQSVAFFFAPFKPFSVHTNSGTALQERAHTIASRNETIHSLLVNLSLETTLEGRAEGRDEIYVVAQKTVTTV